MFYLTYRPRKVDEIDNTDARSLIQKILASKKVPHALLLVGQKGTGKTSTARIIAKSVNCMENAFAKKGSSIEPCGTCGNCKSIDQSSSSDVTELDAASNRGIEEVRAIIKEAALLPMHSRFRIFIVDEAHMITSDAFNALLKTLEEPPSTVLFILATTNLEKIPKTIVSRCFVVPFKKAQKQDIVRMLGRIVKSENIKVADDVLKLVSSHSDGSFRDAAKLLEELVIQSKLEFAQAQIFLGILSKENLLQILEKEDLKKALSWIEEFAGAGGSIKHLLEELLESLRVLLLEKNGITQEDQDETKLSFSLQEITQLIKLFTEAYQMLKISPIDSIPLEIAVVDFYNSRKR